MMGGEGGYFRPFPLEIPPQIVVEASDGCSTACVADEEC